MRVCVCVCVQAPSAVTKDEVEVDIVVGCRRPEASRTVFMCLNNAGVVYDGRIVVDNTFRTSDPQIYAAGTIVRFSRQYGRNIRLEHYSSREVGTALAASVVGAFQGQPKTDQMPILGQQSAKVIGCQVPGLYTFLYTGCPTAIAHPTLEPPPGGRRVQTVSESGAMFIVLDATQTVYSVAVIGRLSIPPNKLACLVRMNAHIQHAHTHTHTQTDTHAHPHSHHACSLHQPHAATTACACKMLALSHLSVCLCGTPVFACVLKAPKQCVGRRCV